MKNYEKAIEYMSKGKGGLTLVVRGPHGDVGKMTYDTIQDLQRDWIDWYGPGPDGEMDSEELKAFRKLSLAAKVGEVLSCYDYTILGVYACREAEKWEHTNIPVFGGLDDYFEPYADTDRMTERCASCGATRTLLHGRTRRDSEIKGGHLPHDALTKMGLILATTKEK